MVVVASQGNWLGLKGKALEGAGRSLGEAGRPSGRKRQKSVFPYEVVLYVINPCGGGLRTGRRGGGEEERTVGDRYAQQNPRYTDQGSSEER